MCRKPASCLVSIGRSFSPASASPKHTKFRADVFTILSAFCLVFFVFARYNHTLQRTLGGAAAPIPEKEVCSMRNWFSRHPVSFMAFYLLFYLSAFHWLEVHIAVPDVLVHCHLDDLIPFCKYAIVPYFAWFLWIPFTLFYLLWKAPRADAGCGPPPPCSASPSLRPRSCSSSTAALMYCWASCWPWRWIPA